MVLPPSYCTAVMHLSEEDKSICRSSVIALGLWAAVIHLAEVDRNFSSVVAMDMWRSWILDGSYTVQLKLLAWPLCQKKFLVCRSLQVASAAAHWIRAVALIPSGESVLRHERMSCTCTQRWWHLLVSVPQVAMGKIWCKADRWLHSHLLQNIQGCCYETCFQPPWPLLTGVCHDPVKGNRC